MVDLRVRLRKFNLVLHDDKTRLIEFGRFAAQNRKRDGKGKPKTFDFLGFTHVCGKTRRGKFIVHRHTVRRRMRAKLLELKIRLYPWVSRVWRTLKRRSQRHRLTWERMSRLIARWLPHARIWHPYPDLRMYVITRGGSPVR